MPKQLDCPPDGGVSGFTKRWKLKQGDFKMGHTVELLEAIGADAELRHADRDSLAAKLREIGASRSLQAAVASGNSMDLAPELGHRQMGEPQIIHSPGKEDEEDPDEDNDEDKDGE